MSAGSTVSEKLPTNPDGTLVAIPADIYVGKNVAIGDNVTISYNVEISSHVRILDDVKIDDQCKNQLLYTRSGNARRLRIRDRRRCFHWLWLRHRSRHQRPHRPRQSSRRHKWHAVPVRRSSSRWRRHRAHWCYRHARSGSTVGCYLPRLIQQNYLIG